MTIQPTVRRGDIWLVSLDPTIGHEIKKTRPTLVVANDIYNEHNWVVLVMPLTSNDTAEYDQVLIQPPKVGLQNASVTLPDLLRTVDRRRLGAITPQSMNRINRSMRIVLDVN
jgi:mRNA interferase MazF